MISEAQVTRQQLRASMKPKHGWSPTMRDAELQRIRSRSAIRRGQLSMDEARESMKDLAVSADKGAAAATELAATIEALPEIKGASSPMAVEKRTPVPVTITIENPTGLSVLDRVTWTSSGKAKEGQIVAVVPAGKLPIDVDMKVKTDAGSRDHVSYVVQSGKTLYWPRVSLLERV